MKICIIGTGYVGLTTGLCLADFGHDVICVDKDEHKINLLKDGILHIHESGLKDILKKTLKMRKIKFTADAEDAVLASNVIFIAVGTPSIQNGSADVSAVFEVAELIAQNLNEFKIIILKSTVPIATHKTVYSLIKEKSQKQDLFAVVSNPEFLRQGKALMDFIHPHRIVIGSTDPKAIEILKKIYEPIDAPVMVTTPENAEIIKYASNSFLAMKISYINEIANLCERYGADVKEVAKGMGLDPRIGDRFLEAGLGFGGSCFPKDMRALVYSANKVDYDFKLLKTALEVNEQQKIIAVEKLRKHLGSLAGKQIGILGLSFKPDTDDIREASSITLIRELLKEGAKVKAYDAKAEHHMKKIFAEVQYCNLPYEVACQSDALVLVTEWAEYCDLDFEKIKNLLKTPLIIDGRNLFNPEEMKKNGFIYEGVGRL